MFKQENDSRDRKLAGERSNEIGIDVRGPDVVETPRDRLQDFDGVFSFLVLTVSAVKPCRNR